MECLRVAGELEALSAIAVYVKMAAAKAGLDRKRTYHLRLAVDEIATNIITHGYQEAGLTGELVLQVKMAPQSLTIIMEDTGASFDPRQSSTIAVHQFDRPLEDRPLGGLGVYLALHSVDEFIYEQREGHNRNIFVMYIFQ